MSKSVFCLLLYRHIFEKTTHLCTQRNNYVQKTLKIGATVLFISLALTMLFVSCNSGSSEETQTTKITYINSYKEAGSQPVVRKEFGSSKEAIDFPWSVTDMPKGMAFVGWIAKDDENSVSEDNAT